MPKSQADAFYDPVDQKNVYTITIYDHDIVGLEFSRTEENILMEAKQPDAPVSLQIAALAIIARLIEEKAAFNGDPDGEEPIGLLKA